jgi:hypothetical protein
MTPGKINMDAAREAHPLKSIGCFIKKPITAEQLLRRIKAELKVSIAISKIGLVTSSRCAKPCLSNTSNSNTLSSICKSIATCISTR